MQAEEGAGARFFFFDEGARKPDTRREEQHRPQQRTLGLWGEVLTRQGKAESDRSRQRKEGDGAKSGARPPFGKQVFAEDGVGGLDERLWLGLFYNCHF